MSGVQSIQNIHSTRITTKFPFIVYDGSGLALYDIIFTIIGAVILSYMSYKKITVYNVLCISLILYSLAIILHIIFKVNSPVANAVLEYTH